MDFVTVDGKLSVEGNVIRQKRLTNLLTRNLILFSFFFLWFIDFFIERLAVAQETGKASKWISVIVFGFILLLAAWALYEYVFRYHWKNKLSVSDITKVKVALDDEKGGLETDVTVTMLSKRHKIFKFRTLEKQYDHFVNTIRSIKPDIQFVTG